LYDFDFVLLFGSFVNGTTHELSDVDIGIYSLNDIKLQEKISLEDVKKNKFDEWALRYGIFESIQIIIDIACHVAAKYNLGSSKSYVECTEKRRFLLTLII